MAGGRGGRAGGSGWRGRGECSSSFGVWPFRGPVRLARVKEASRFGTVEMYKLAPLVGWVGRSGCGGGLGDRIEGRLLRFLRDRRP